MTNPVKIYGMAQSPNVRKPLAVAHEIGVPVEVVNCMPGGDELKAISPFGRVPAMDDNGFKLSESNAIMLHLANKKPNSLYPDDSEKRDLVNQWLFWDVAHMVPAYQPIQFEKLVKSMMNLGEPDQAVIDQSLIRFAREAAVLDAALDGKEWLVGASPTLADFCVGAAFTYAEAIALPIAEHAHIRAWLARVMDLDGFKKTALKF